MIGSLYSGISGLKANTSAMAVIGDNIANVGTNGFKGSRVSFSNVFSATIGQSKTQIGRGVTMSAVSPSWETGSLENTNSATDLSINGKGLFVVRNPANGVQYYTRAGQFEFDKDNYLVTQDGLIVQGYPIDASGNLGGLTDLTMPAGNIAPQATDLITLGLNLDAGAAATDTFDTMLTVYDSLGNAVDLTITFTPDLAAAAADPAAATVWDWAVSSSAGACATTGSIAFDASGDIVPASCTPVSSNPTLVVTGLSGADLNIDWEYLDASSVSDGSITGYAAESTKSSQTQNGFPSGTLQGVAVDEDGIFTGVYSNGQTSSFAQIALADFGSYSGLNKMGSNLFSESLASGQAVISVPATGGVGSIAPSTLEMSNVDLATEFVELITTQRAFQANSKVITTSDEILAELINIKR
jgi:flagellar hook protein FlgE